MFFFVGFCLCKSIFGFIYLFFFYFFFLFFSISLLYFSLFLFHLCALILPHMGWLHVRQEIVFLKQYC